MATEDAGVLTGRRFVLGSGSRGQGMTSPLLRAKNKVIIAHVPFMVTVIQQYLVCGKAFE